MSSRQLPVSARVGAWAAFCVLAGIVAMHGLGAHGTMASDPDMASMAMPVVAAPVSHPTAQIMPAAPSPGQDHVMAGCVVTLSGVLLLGPPLLLGRGRARWRVAASPLLLDVARRARAPDPPDLVRLSVCRC